MNEQCCHRLKLTSSTALSPSWTMPIPQGLYGLWSPHASQIFSKEWLTYMRSIGINIHHALVFYRAAGVTSYEAHIDTDADSGEFVNFALNWVIGGKGSKMHWYKTKDSNYLARIKDQNTKVPYTTIQFNNLDLVESTEIIPGEVVLVRTSLPHSISMGPEPRWCISARADSKDLKSWNDIVEHFREKRILVEV